MIGTTLVWCQVSWQLIPGRFLIVCEWGISQDKVHSGDLALVAVFWEAWGYNVGGSLSVTCSALSQHMTVAPGHSGGCRVCLEGALKSPGIQSLSLSEETKHRNWTQKSNRNFLRNSPHLHFREFRGQIPASVGPYDLQWGLVPTDVVTINRSLAASGGKGSASQFVRIITSSHSFTVL